MDIRYISKIDGDNITLTSPTSAIAGEKEITVNIAELNELRKSINIYGFNAITGSIKTLTIGEVEKAYQSKLRLVGKEYTPKTKARVVNCKKGKSIINVDVVAEKEIEHSKVSSKIQIDWEDIFSTIRETINLSPYDSYYKVYVAITFDFGMYESVSSNPYFSTHKKNYMIDTDDFVDIVITDIKFTDNVDFRYTRLITDMFNPLLELIREPNYELGSNCIIDFSKYTMERIESMAGLLNYSEVNMFMPTIKTEKNPRLRNIVVKAAYRNAKVFIDNLKFADTYCSDGFYEIAGDYVCVRRLNLSKIKSVLKYGKKGTNPIIIAINELVLDCELTENTFKDMGVFRFVVDDIVMTNKFKIKGYSEKKAKNVIESQKSFKVEKVIIKRVNGKVADNPRKTMYKILSKDYRISNTSKTFLKSGAVPEEIVENMRGYEMCVEVRGYSDTEYSMDSPRICNVTSKSKEDFDLYLALAFVSLITQNFLYFHRDGAYFNLYSPVVMQFSISYKEKGK